MEMKLPEHFAPLGLGDFNGGGFYKHGVPTGLDAFALARAKTEMHPRFQLLLFNSRLPNIRPRYETDLIRSNIQLI
jgi:hypothetical protein